MRNCLPDSEMTDCGIVIVIQDRTEVSTLFRRTIP